MNSDKDRQNTQFLKLAAIILPAIFWILIVVLRNYLYREPFVWQNELFIVMLILLGSGLFSTWIFNVVGQREREIRIRNEQLAALREAGLALTTVLNLNDVLQKVAELAKDLVQAKYGALGVLGENGEYIEQFFTIGISLEQRALMGPHPTGLGLLGVLLKKGEPIRVSSIPDHPEAAGFPANHPLMKSLLGVPIRSKGRIIGDLYLTDKFDAEGQDEFTDRDQEILEMFATQAAIAIENAQLYRQNEQLAIMNERERFGMDLHDGIIQSIYAIGLMLEDTQLRLEASQKSTSEGIGHAIHGLNEVIRDLRNYILDLRPQRFQGKNLLEGLNELARDLRANSFMDIEVYSGNVSPNKIPDVKTVEVLHIAQEALSNIRKHARASKVTLSLSRENGTVMLEIIDNGIGIPTQAPEKFKGNGLRNMRERAANVSGELEIELFDPRGTCVRLTFPDDNR